MFLSLWIHQNTAQLKRGKGTRKLSREGKNAIDCGTEPHHLKMASGQLTSPESSRVSLCSIQVIESVSIQHSNKSRDYPPFLMFEWPGILQPASTGIEQWSTILDWSTPPVINKNLINLSPLSDESMSGFVVKVCVRQKQFVVGTSLGEAIIVIGAIGGDGKSASNILFRHC